jgi:4'-phosphopantetheinyl transferase
MRATFSDHERARADRFVFDRDRRRFTVAHARMRQLLGAYAGDAQRLRFRAGPHGKPELVDTPHLRFSLTHSHELALLAVARNVDLGVDVEALRPIGAEAIEHFFSEPERDALRSVLPEQRLVASYSCWTRKEAFLKGIGVGLMRDLDSFAVSLAPHDSTITCLRGDDTDGWTMQHLQPADGYVGALAFKAAQMSVQCFWAPE